MAASRAWRKTAPRLGIRRRLFEENESDRASLSLYIVTFEGNNSCGRNHTARCASTTLLIIVEPLC